MELAKYCGNKTIGEFVGGLSEISKKNRSKRGARNKFQEYESESQPSIVVNINYIFPGGSPGNILPSNILPATPTTTNFLFDWNQGKLCPETVSFNESRFSEISNESISNISLISCPATSNDGFINTSFTSNPLSSKEGFKDSNISTPVAAKENGGLGKRRRRSISPTHKRKKDSSHKNAFSKLIVDYRWNTIHKVLRIFKVPLVYFIARELKALELYTDLLDELKMNCKKEASVSKRIKESEDDSIPKSKRAARMEENFRHMLMPDSKEEANRKDECEFLVE